MPDWKNIKFARYWKEKSRPLGGKEVEGKRWARTSSLEQTEKVETNEILSSGVQQFLEIVQKSFSHIKKMMKDVDVGFWLLKNIPSWCVTKIIALMFSVRIFTPAPFREMNTYRQDPPEFGNASLTPFCPNKKNKSNAGISVISSITFGTLVAVF